MVNIAKVGDSAVKFTFTDNDHYLFNGEIEVPLNSLLLILDESDLATFKKIDGDPFVSFLISNSNFNSKEALETFYKENMVGGGGGSGSGVSSATVQTMIDESISGKSDTTAVTAVNDVLTAHTANTNIHVTSEEKTAWNAKSDFSGSYNDLTDKPTIPTVPTDVSAFNNDAGYITADSISGKADVSAITAIESAMTEDEEVTAAALNNLQENKADTTAVTAVNNVLTAHTADTTIHVTSSDKSTWSGKQDALVSGTNIKTINNESILGSGNITISGGSGGNANIVEVTQAEYDALVSGGTVDPDAMYVITDATEVNVSGFVQTSAITTAVTSASTNSEIPSALAVYAATSGGSGGGKAISAGTNISVTTGETADTINCTLPFSYEGDNLRTTVSGNSFVGYPHYSLVFGSNNTLQGNNSDTVIQTSKRIVNSNIIGLGNNLIRGKNSAIIGYSNTVGIQFGQNENIYVIGNTNKITPSTSNNSANNNFIVGTDNTITEKTHNYIFGYGINPSNSNEFSIGKYNKSVNDGTTSGSTYFSIGNGTSSALTSNAFEIRQNGDIYCNNGTSDVKLQDYIQFKIVQITQSDYDLLPTKDSSTVYIIVN